METLKNIDEIKKTQKQKVILGFSLVFFSVWFIANVLTITMDTYSIVIDSDWLNFIPTLCSVFYALFLLCFAQYMQVMSFKVEQILTYIIVATVVVSSALNYWFIRFLTSNIESIDVNSYTQMYSALIMFITIVQSLIMFVLGILLIVRKKNNVKGVILVGIAFILKIVFTGFGYIFQTVSFQMDNYYGLFGVEGYKRIILLASIIQLLGFIILGLGIIYFYVKSSETSFGLKSSDNTF